ncbi:GlxA family transcriptional regulator [Lentzea sp. NPDC042327]|uniref:GlxA family transcriptional regulator n=1 Tax=Lentzea sp. NPDC042327 TaxID=3154801 RepID=UPI0033EB76C5
MDDRRGVAPTRTHSVLVVLFDGVQPLDVAGPLDVFSLAARCVGTADTPPYVVRTASLGGGTIRAAGGLRVVPDLDLAAADTPDLLLVPGGPGVGDVDERLVAWLRERAPGSRRVVSVCTGAWLLAEAGLLDGRRATTHWESCSHLADKHPRVRVETEPIFVQDGPFYTSAGVTAGVDLAIALVEEDFGRAVAHEIARLLVVFLRRPGNQAQFSAQLSAQAAYSDPLRDVQHWATANLAADLSVPALAGRAGLSPRQFARAFAEQAGVTPGRFVDLIRLEAAQRMLADTGEGVLRIARRCGYGTQEGMRRAFLRELGVSPTEYRRSRA